LQFKEKEVTKKIHFWQSVNFKIAIVFVMLLTISIEIIGNYFINNLERQTITKFQEKINSDLEKLSSTLGDEMNNSTQSKTKADESIQKQIDNFGGREIVEIRVVDDKEIIRGAYGNKGNLAIGHKNTSRYLKNFKNKQEIIKEHNERFQISVQPILSNTNNKYIGAILIKVNLEKEYESVQEIARLLLSSSLISLTITLLIASVVSRSIIKPISELHDQALRISENDFSKKIKVFGHDELSQLSTTFNELTDNIKETQESLISERSRLDSILKHMNDGVIAANRHGEITMINEMALSQLNLTEDDALGIVISDLLDLDDHYNLSDLLEATPEVLVIKENDRDKSAFYVDFSLIKNNLGLVTGIVAVLHDVTEQQKVELERQQFVSNVSHELRTPLTSVQSYLETLVSGAWKDQEHALEFLMTALKETERMIRMINDLLQLSRLDQKRFKLEVEFIDFNDFVNFILDRFELILEKQNNEGTTAKDYKIIRQITNKTLWVEIDPDRMTQVIDNIMNNAIKYSPNGGKIQVRLMDTNKYVILSITDEGLGIPKADLRKIFDRFFRVDKARSRAQGGSGLGLSIAQEIMIAHGGHLWVESHEGIGSTFYISLPYQIYDEEEEWS
jgi:two-component system sensor histidine kinase VicK